MKKSSVVTLSMEFSYKSSLTANSTRNIMLLSFKSINWYIRQLQILATPRILSSNQFSPQETPSVPFLYKHPKKQSFLLSLSIAQGTLKICSFSQVFVYEKFFADFSLFSPYVMFISWSSSYFTSCHLYFPHVVEY